MKKKELEKKKMKKKNYLFKNYSSSCHSLEEIIYFQNNKITADELQWPVINN